MSAIGTVQRLPPPSHHLARVDGKPPLSESGDICGKLHPWVAKFRSRSPLALRRTAWPN
ncbi:MAG: hypothetical protein V4640_05260 [Verrucomicrobiota bacterium]